MTSRRFAEAGYPAWIREIDHTLPVKPQFLLTGNIRDTHLLPLSDPRGPDLVTTIDVLSDLFIANGYSVILRYDPVDGLAVVYEAEAGAAAQIHPSVTTDRTSALSLAALAEVLKAVAGYQTGRAAIVIDYGSRLNADDDDSDPERHTLLATAEKLSHHAQADTRTEGRLAPLHNSMVWVMDRELDLPHWLSASDAVRVVSIPVPTLDVRTAAAERVAPMLPGYLQLAPADRAAVVARFGALTHGMTLRSLTEIGVLAVDGAVPAEQVEDAVRGYRVGIVDSPWRQPRLQQAIRDGEATLSAAVLGQEPAIRKSLDILTRSTLGLTGAQSGGHAGRPQGILFFAGPTGVGKTELAKSIATLLFGTEDAYTRFDMSEFSAEQSEARLIGAPPGFVGHDAGGELTNAVRQRPFSLLLFDEIEKAHPRILDKFLQILEDGRLTDGSGSTVYFSETVIVFTSNLGIYATDATGQRVPLVLPGQQTYDELVTTVRAAIGDDFTRRIGRPELLNRIGDNVVVFDFISPAVGRRLVDKYLGNVVARVAAQLSVEVVLAPGVVDQVAEVALEETALAFGGRGVGSVIESVFVNPLARALFARHDQSPTATVSALVRTEHGWRVELA